MSRIRPNYFAAAELQTTSLMVIQADSHVRYSTLGIWYPGSPKKLRLLITADQPKRAASTLDLDPTGDSFQMPDLYL